MRSGWWLEAVDDEKRLMMRSWWWEAADDEKWLMMRSGWWWEAADGEKRLMMRSSWWLEAADEKRLMMRSGFWWEAADDEKRMMMRSGWWWEAADDEKDDEKSWWWKGYRIPPRVPFGHKSGFSTKVTHRQMHRRNTLVFSYPPGYPRVPPGYPHHARSFSFSELSDSGNFWRKTTFWRPFWEKKWPTKKIPPEYPSCPIFFV